VRIDDSGETVQGVRESQLETLVPKGQGIRVLILAGEHRGQKARLLQRNADTGAAAVQLVADFSVVKLSLDDVAEYVGPEGDDE
jgi:G patch domain/KOW motif-containing protein